MYWFILSIFIWLNPIAIFGKAVHAAELRHSCVTSGSAFPVRALNMAPVSLSIPPVFKAFIVNNDTF